MISDYSQTILRGNKSLERLIIIVSIDKGWMYTQKYLRCGESVGRGRDGEGIGKREVKWRNEREYIYRTLAVMNSCAAFASAKLQFEEK